MEGVWSRETPPLHRPTSGERIGAEQEEKHETGNRHPSMLLLTGNQQNLRVKLTLPSHLVSTRAITRPMETLNPMDCPPTSGPKRPNVFSYLDYRDYLKDAYNHRKEMNPRFSENAFALAAGFGKNSRGYLGLVVKGKRNLTAKSIVGFARALSLPPQEALYFENMVHFCQADTEKEKVYFFDRLKVAAKGQESVPVALLDSHLRFLNEWHLVVLREMVALSDFREDAEWIARRLGGRVSATKAREGLADLLTLGLIARGAEGKLVQSDPVVLYKDTKQNFKNACNLHKDFAARASAAMVDQPYEKRAAQLITLSVPAATFEDLRREMQEMTENILKKYGSMPTGTDQVVQMGIQLLQVTN